MLEVFICLFFINNLFIGVGEMVIVFGLVVIVNVVCVVIGICLVRFLILF